MNYKRGLHRGGRHRIENGRETSTFLGQCTAGAMIAVIDAWCPLLRNHTTRGKGCENLDQAKEKRDEN